MDAESFNDAQEQSEIPSVKKESLLGQERSEWSYFSDAEDKELRELEEKLDELRGRSDAPEQKYIDPLESETVGTGAFFTNNPSDEFLNKFKPNASDADRESLRTYMIQHVNKRYFGCSDVRGCVFVLIREPDSEVFSLGHLPFNSAEDKEGMERKMELLTAPIDSDNVRVDIVGAYEEEASIDTLAAIVKELEDKYHDVTYETVDVLNRNSGDRKPYYDGAEGKVYESSL